MEYAVKHDMITRHVSENIQTLSYTAICFLAPFVMGHPQLLVGIIVNFALVMAGLRVNDYRTLPIIIFPSFGVLARGVIFGPFTFFLIYMIPFIWLGNALLVYGMKMKKGNKWLKLVLSSAGKAGFLFSAAYLLVALEVLPKVFLVSMGPVQLTTAFIGGSLAVATTYLRK